MTFSDLHQRLIDNLRQRVRSGEMTERGLARTTGVSQPHIHHVLKGQRLLSGETADEILRHLHMDLLDLIELEELLQSRRRRGS
jgi:predicted transcriptional regulator